MPPPPRQSTYTGNLGGICSESRDLTMPIPDYSEVIQVHAGEAGIRLRTTGIHPGTQVRTIPDTPSVVLEDWLEFKPDEMGQVQRTSTICPIGECGKELVISKVKPDRCK